MPLPLVIINPESAGGATGRAWPKIASDLRTHFGPFTCAFTERSGQAAQLAADASRDGVRLIIACGGDGTTSQVANGIIDAGYDSELGLLPSGTGGDFRKTLQIPTQARAAAQILKKGHTRKIDVGRVTFTNSHGIREARYFIGVSSFGISADVIEGVKKKGSQLAGSGSRLGGRLSFGLTMLQTAMRSPITRVIVRFDDDRERHLSVTNLCIANARYFGGGMKIAPNAKLTDGKFDVVTIGDLGAVQILANAPRVYLGSHLKLPKVSHLLAKKIAVRPAEEKDQVAIEVDGELPGFLPATFQIVSEALNVRCP